MNHVKTYRRRFLKFLLLTAVIVLLATLLYLHRSYDEEVTVVSPTTQDIESTASTDGIVVPVDDFKARANFSGIVEDIPVKLGQEVRAGQLLVRMRDTFAASRVAAASAALLSAELNLQNIEHNGSQEDRIGFEESIAHAESEQVAASRDLDLLKKLQQKGSASKAEVTAGTRRVENDNAVLKALRDRTSNRYSDTDRATWAGRVNEARSALNAEQENQANANIVSPISGTVYLKPVAKFDFVQMGANLVDVADLTRIEINASFDEPDIGKLKQGQSVRILWDGRPSRTWHGHLLHAPLAVTATGTRNVGDSVVTVDDANSDLPAETNVTLIVTIQKQSNVLTIPREALHTADGQAFVFCVVEKKLVRTPVDVGFVDLIRVQIKGGLSLKDVIALHTIDNREMRNGMTIKVSK